MAERWLSEVGAILAKEAQTEWRSRTGLMTAGLFNLVAVTAIAFATINQRVSPGMAAGLLWLTLLFSAVVALPRTFLHEEETGTGDLLRLTARAHAVFWGKALFSLAQLWVSAAVLGVLFGVLVPTVGLNPGWLALSLVVGCLGVSGTVSLVGALVAQAQNRFLLASAVALPLLLPVVAIAIGATGAAFGGIVDGGTQRALLALGAYAVACFSVGPYLYAAVWKG